MAPVLALRKAIDWGELSPLRLRARSLADGVYAGAHRSARRGPGVEFGGHREYVAGDDLRWLDRRAMLRHDRLIVRQFEMETERVLRVVVDATASMTYRGSRAIASKYAYASIVAAALVRVAGKSGDPAGLAFLGGTAQMLPVPPAQGAHAFERVCAALETGVAQGDATKDPRVVEHCVQQIGRSTRRGAVTVVLSDLWDLPPAQIEALAALAHGGRVLLVAQIADPDERNLPFREPTRVQALEGGAMVDCDASAFKEYDARAHAQTEQFRALINARQGRFVALDTSMPPVQAVREILRGVQSA